MNPHSRPAPSFKGFSASSDASSRAKQRNRSTDARHECLLRSLLWKQGLRYRKNVRSLPGKPDIVFVAARVAVFCDGDFWHGRDWPRLSRKLRTGNNAAYWIPKIRTNRSRDRRNERLLKKEGWTVIRVWETDVHRNPQQITDAVGERVRRNSRRGDALH